MNTTQPTHAEKQYLHTMTAGAWLPFAQSTGIALVIGIGVWIIAGMVFDVMDPHKLALFFFAVSWVVMLIRLMTHWFSLTGLERIVNYDINNDGVIGETQPEEVKPLRVMIDLSTVSKDKSYQSSRIKFPGTQEQLETLANGLLNNMAFTERTWSGNGRLYTSPEFRELKTVMFAHGLIEYISEADKRQGIRLTDKGTLAMQQLANSPTPE